MGNYSDSYDHSITNQWDWKINSISFTLKRNRVEPKFANSNPANRRCRSVKQSKQLESFRYGNGGYIPSYEPTISPMNGNPSTKQSFNSMIMPTRQNSSFLTSICFDSLDADVSSNKTKPFQSSPRFNITIAASNDTENFARTIRALKNKTSYSISSGGDAQSERLYLASSAQHYCKHCCLEFPCVTQFVEHCQVRKHNDSIRRRWRYQATYVFV